MANKQICPTHDRPLKYSRKEKMWYCPDCLQSAYLSWQAQQEAVKRYRDSEKGKEAQKRYEDSDKGQTARQRYLKSDKYKERRREYNQRLKESLQIARAAKAEKPSVQRREEPLTSEELTPLVMDIMEYQDTIGVNPSTADVKEWSKDVYKKTITTEKARELIDLTLKRRQT